MLRMPRMVTAVHIDERVRLKPSCLERKLGIQIKNSAALFQFETAWAAILVACILGIAFYLAVSLAEIATLRRYPSAERAQRQGTS